MCYFSVWPDWAIYCTLGNFSKSVAAIILPKLPTFLGKFCKVFKIFHFSSEIIFGQLLKTFGNFLLVTLLLSLPFVLCLPERYTMFYLFFPSSSEALSPFYTSSLSLSLSLSLIHFHILSKRQHFELSQTKVTWTSDTFVLSLLNFFYLLHTFSFVHLNITQMR